MTYFIDQTVAPDDQSVEAAPRPYGSVTEIAVADAYHKEEHPEPEPEDDWTLANHKFSSYEEKVFRFVSSFHTKHTVSFGMLLIANCLADLQLLFFSWRPDLFVNGSLWVIQYIFNPLFYVVERLPLLLHIVFLLLSVTAVASLFYTSKGFKTGKFKSVWPVYYFRGLTTLFSTAFFVPALQTYLYPTMCSSNGDVLGYGVYGVKCTGGTHIPILATSAIGILFVFVYNVILELLAYEANPKSPVGKVNGFFEIFYFLIRLGLVLLNYYGSLQITMVVNLVLVVITLAVFLRQQPFYEATLNNTRFAFLFTSFFVSLCSLIASFISIPSGHEAGYAAAVLTISCLFFPLGYWLNGFIVRIVCKRIYTGLKTYLTGNDATPLEEVKIRKSQLSMLYDNIDAIVVTKAIEQSTNFFKFSNWPEISIRFIRTSYLSSNSVNLALALFDTAFGEHPKSQQLHFAYLRYIDQYFPEYVKIKDKHYKILAKKCNLTFADRFQLYIWKKIAVQVSIRGIADGDEDDGQFDAEIEYRANENLVRRFHTQTLNQIKEFWQSIRDGKTEFELSTQITYISELADRTNNMYYALTRRFQDSKNLLNLHARFVALAFADFETAKTISDIAENAVAAQAQENNTKNASQPAKSGGGDSDAVDVMDNPRNDLGGDKKSIASSNNNSVASREAKLIRQKRTLLAERLDAPMKSYLRSGILFLLVSGGLIVASVLVSFFLISYTTSSLGEFAMNEARYKIQMYAFNVHRVVEQAVKFRDETEFIALAEDLYENYLDWEQHIAPFYHVGPALTEQVTLRLNIDGKYEIRTMNGMDAVSMISAYNNEIALSTFSDAAYATEASAFGWTPIRFFIDNDAILDDYLTKLRDAEIDEFSKGVTSQETLMIACYLILLVILSVFGYALTYLNLRRIRDHHNKIIGLLAKMTRGPLLKMITQIEEEVENICVEDEAGSAQLNAKKSVPSWRFVVPWQYLIGLTLAVGGSAYLLEASMGHVAKTIEKPKIFDKSNYRKSCAYKILRLSHELSVPENITRKPGSVMFDILEQINLLESLNEDLATLLAPFLPPFEPKNHMYSVLREGKCFNENHDFCDSAEAEYYPEVGFTKELAMSGIDVKLTRYLEEVKRFIDAGVYDIASGRYAFLEHLFHQLDNDLPYVVDELTYYNNKKSANLQTLLIIVGVLVLVMLILTFYTGYYSIAKTYVLGNKQIVSILYSIPAADRSKLFEINTFLESAGASIN